MSEPNDTQKYISYFVKAWEAAGVSLTGTSIILKDTPYDIQEALTAPDDRFPHSAYLRHPSRIGRLDFKDAGECLDFIECAQFVRERIAPVLKPIVQRAREAAVKLKARERAIAQVEGSLEALRRAVEALTSEESLSLDASKQGLQACTASLQRASTDLSSLWAQHRDLECVVSKVPSLTPPLLQSHSLLADLQEISEKVQGPYERFMELEKRLDRDLLSLAESIKEEVTASQALVGVSTVKQFKVKPMLTSLSLKKADLYNIRSPSQYPEPVREDLPVPNGHCFTISNVLDSALCYKLIKATEEIGYEGLGAEFEADFRNNERVMIMSRKLADILWKAIAPYFTRKDIFRMIPIGFGNEGTWKPLRLNECIKFNKYLSGTYFLPHIDGPWIPKWDEASIFTVVFYLNEQFHGGETLFLEGDELVVKSTNQQKKVLATVTPKRGSCLVFNHDVLHESTPITQGIKYIARTEVIFQRTDSNMFVNPYQYQREPNYLKFLTLYQASQDEYQKGNPAKFMDLYYEALKLQVEAMKKSLPTYVPLTKMTFPMDIWIEILKNLSVFDVLQLMGVSKGMKEVVMDGEVWKYKYEVRFPKQVFESFGIHPSLQDWYKRFKIANLLTFTKTSYGIVDIGTHSIKYINPPKKNQSDLGATKSWTCKNSLYTLGGYSNTFSFSSRGHFRRGCSPDQLELGKGIPIVENKNNKWCYAHDIDIILEKLAINHLTFILSSPIRFHFPSYFGEKVQKITMSVAALNAYNRESGVVISLGHTFYWIEEVKQNEVVFSFLYDLEESSFQGIVTALIKKWRNFHKREDQNPIEFCCIGGKCDQQNVNMIKTIIDLENITYCIISDIDQRIYAPLIGAILNPITRKISPKWL